MNRRALVLALVVLVPAPGHAYQRPGVNERISVSSVEGQSNDISGMSGTSQALSADGRYVAFPSYASNLVAGDTNGAGDVFVRDRVTGTTERVSVDSAGRQGLSLGPCGSGTGYPAISADGRHIAFQSCFNNLVPSPPDLKFHYDVFVHDRKTRTTSVVSVNTKGELGNGNSTRPSISADGRLVAFTSAATNLATEKVCPGDAVPRLICETAGPYLPGAKTQVYVRDVVRRTTTVVSVAASGVTADGNAFHAALSPDGRYVAFTSIATNLDAADTTGPDACPHLTGEWLRSCPDVFLHDRVSRRTELVSFGLDGKSAYGVSGELAPASISRDNRYLVFSSGARNVVPNANAPGLYVRDRTARRTEQVSVDSSGRNRDLPAGGCGPYSGGYDSHAISADGRYVVFSTSVTLVPRPALWEIFQGIAVHDRRTGTTECGPVDVHGRLQAEYHNSYTGSISADGRYISFASDFPRIVAGDTNGKTDIFFRDRGRALAVGGFVRSGTDAPATTPMIDGADLAGVTVIHRPHLRDLLVRLEVPRMPLYALANPALVYGVDLVVDGVRRQVRVTKADGYGFTGREVVVSVPYAGGRLGEVRAFTTLGGVRLDEIAIGGEQR